MRKYLYQYESELGMMYIVQIAKNLYLLASDEEDFDTSNSPGSVADNVFTHHSGWDEWDESDFEAPDGLSEWYRVPS